MTRIEAFALTLAVFTLVASAGTALAQEDYSRTGPYLGIEGSVGVPRQLEDSIEVLSLGPPTGGKIEGLEVDPSLGLHARAGWRLHPRLAGEIHFEYLDEFNVSSGNGQRAFPSSGADLGSVSSWTLTGDLNGYLMTGRVQPFLSVGAGVMNVNTKDRAESGRTDRVRLGFPGDGSAFAVRMGGGIDWYLNEYVAFSLNASYVLPTGSLKNYDYFSVGWGLRFPFWWLMPGAENGEDVAAATRQSAPGSPPTERFTSAADLFDEPYYRPARARRRPEPIQIAALDDWQMVVDERSEATNWLLTDEPATRSVTVLAQQSATEEEQAPDPGPPPTEIEAVEPEIDVDIEEILVQGEKSQGVLASDAAMSQVVFTPEDLTAERITDLSDLAEYTPNLEINKGFAASGATIFIRGIGLNDYNANASSSGAVYVDGVYMNSPVGQLFQFFDTQGVEVLRGPQGSLFGRNATAGAILITSRVPDGTFNGYSSFTYGNFDTVEVEAALGFPIISDMLSGRVAFRYAIRDGITHNRCGTNPNGDVFTEGVAGQCSRATQEPFFGPVPTDLPKKVNAIDVWAARGIVLFEPTADQEWILNVHGGQNRGDAAQLQSRGALVPPTLDGTGRDNLGYRDRDRDPYAGDYDLVEPEYLDLFGANLQGQIEIGDFSLNSISGFESNERSILDNTDASPRVMIHIDLEDEAWQASQEFRLGSHLGDQLDWDAGAYFLYEELKADNSFTTRAIIRNRQTYEQQLLTWAVFGYFTYELMDRSCGLVLCWFEFEGGVRYNWEQKRFDISAVSGPLDGSRFDQIAQVESEIWDAVTGDAILRWRFADDASLYAKYTRGFKGGHFNGGAFFSAQLVEAVDPERVNAYEIGLKSIWADGQLTLNFSAFYYDYQDYQVFALQNLPGALPLAQLLNAPEVESKGIEVELGVAPTEALNVDLAISVLDTEFTEFAITRSFTRPPCRPGVGCQVFTRDQDFTGNPLPGAPSIQFSASASYELRLGRYGTLVPRVSANYKGRTYFDHGDARGTVPLPNEGASQDPYWLFNAGLEYRTPDERFTVSGWVRNITDQVYLRNSFDQRESLGAMLDYYGDPRTYGITIGVEF